MAGVALFVVCGLELVLGEIPHGWPVPRWLQGVQIAALAGAFLLPVFGYAVGWVKRFPRWSYPYVGLMVFQSWYMMYMATPGLRVLGHGFGGELWGWRAWIPAALATAAALVITRSLRPLLQFFTNIWTDWTLLTFCLFGSVPLLVGIGFDEIDRLYSLWFMIALTLLMCGTALLYMRSARPLQRVAALLGGIVIAVGTVAVGSTLYWLPRGGVSVPGMVVLTAAVLLALLSPALIGLARRAKRIGGF